MILIHALRGNVYHNSSDGDKLCVGLLPDETR